MAYGTELARLQKLRAEKNAAEDALRIKAEELFSLYRPMKAKLSTWPPKWHNMYLRRVKYSASKISYVLSWGECQVTYVDLPAALMDCDEAGMTAGIAEVLAKEGDRYARQAERRQKSQKEAEMTRLQEMANKLGYELAPRA